MSTAKGRRQRCLLRDYMDALPDDVLHEVLSRVGNVKALFMLAVTCRRWLRRFTDPAFLRGLYAVPLAARRGIVLVQLGPRTFGLCNPITGERHLLPPLDCSGRVFSYAIITAADISSSNGASPSGRRGLQAFSQLLLTDLTSSYPECLRSYSAATGSWSAPAIPLNQDTIPGLSLVGERSAVVHQGAAHWLWIDRLGNLLYRLSTAVGEHPCGEVSCTKLPVRVGGAPVLCVTGDGKLSVACVYLVHVTLWTQQQSQAGEGGDEWLRTAVIMIPVALPDPKCPHPPHQPCEMWFSFSRGSMLVLHRNNGAFVLDLDKGVMEKIVDGCFVPPRYDHRRNEIKSVAYQMDLVEFFQLQLGGLLAD
uniref:Uncharacterized protein n=1 Tax=Avena sativa TaxID=4498 RepID=A0ACD5TRU0_AVESA